MKENTPYYHARNEYYGLTFIYREGVLICSNAIMENGGRWIIKEFVPEDWIEIEKYEPKPLWNYTSGIDKIVENEK